MRLRLTANLTPTLYLVPDYIPAAWFYLTLDLEVGGEWTVAAPPDGMLNHPAG